MVVVDAVAVAVAVAVVVNAGKKQSIGIDRSTPVFHPLLMRRAFHPLSPAKPGENKVYDQGNTTSDWVRFARTQVGI